MIKTFVCRSVCLSSSVRLTVRTKSILRGIIPSINDLQVLCNAEAPTPGAAVGYASASPDLQTASTPLAIAALTAMGMAHGNSSRSQDR